MPGAAIPWCLQCFSCKQAICLADATVRPTAAVRCRRSRQRVRSWAAREEWLAFADFSNQLHSPPFGVLLHCDAWQVSVRLRLLLRVHRLKDATHSCSGHKLWTMRCSYGVWLAD